MEITNELGFNPKKTLIYTTLLDKGACNIKDVVRATKLKRPSVYLYLEELKQDGLVHVEFDKNKKLYAPEKPKKLLSLLKRQKQEFNKKEKNLLKIIPKLEANLKKESSQNDVKIFEGKNALWNLGEELLKSHNDFLFIYSGDSLLKHTSFAEILKNFTKRRRQIHSSKLYAITDKNPLGIKKERESDTLFREIRFTKNKLNLDSILCVCGSKICLISLDRNPEGIIIENKSIAKLLEFMFWNIWKSTK